MQLSTRLIFNMPREWINFFENFIKMEEFHMQFWIISRLTYWPLCIIGNDNSFEKLGEKKWYFRKMDYKRYLLRTVYVWNEKNLITFKLMTLWYTLHHHIIKSLLKKMSEKIHYYERTRQLKFGHELPLLLNALVLVGWFLNQLWRI